MLPARDAFLAGVRLFARSRHAKPIVFDEPAITAALDHASSLSAGRAHDEPAALFFACASRSRAFGAAAHDLVPIVARNQARGLGLCVDLDDVVLAILHARIALGAIGFDESREAFAVALHAIGDERPPPPRRPE